MPRTKRLDLPGIAQHIVQRGNNRQACFFHEYDRSLYLARLAEFSAKYGCRVHAYVLMSNHVHLLATPASAGTVAKIMQALGRDYVRHVNLTQGRSGTLWQGRYFSSLVDSDRYLLACQRYIELNPVRAGMVVRPEEYRWSSCGFHVRGEADPLLHPHGTFLSLAADPVARRKVYRAFLGEDVPDEELQAIRLYAARQRAWGSEAFQANVEATLQQRATPGLPGRPRKPKDNGL